MRLSTIAVSPTGALIDAARSRMRRPSGLETTRVRLTATLAVRLVVRVVVDYKPSHGTSVGAVAVAVHPRGKGDGLFLLSEIARVGRCEEPRRDPRAQLFCAAQYLPVQRGPFDGRAVQAHGRTRRSFGAGTRGTDGAHATLQAVVGQGHQARRFQYRHQSWPLRGSGRARSCPYTHRPSLGRRHELHAGPGGYACGAAGVGRTLCAPREEPAVAVVITPFSRNTLTPAGAAVIVCGVRLPKQIAVMPLPNAILFPRVLLPLYIFEPRYKQMLADCLKGERMFAVALLRRGWEKEGRNPTPHPIASIGVIRTCMARPDGSANVILEGVARVRISDYVKQRPYRVALVDPLEG